MRVDPAVSRAKFDSELRKLWDQRPTLERRGIFVLAESTFPHINVYYAPRGPVQLLLPPPPNAAVPLGSMMATQIPALANAGFKVRFDLTDYDLIAPSVDFFELGTNKPLEYLTMFRALEFEQNRGAHQVLLPAHPKTNRPFLCLRGIREYHEHPQHSGDDWLLYRDQMSLFSLVLAVWRVTVDLVRAQLVVTQNTNLIQVNLNWGIFGEKR
jgi:hypothetical protein